jgi:hypothetical protein
MRLKAPHAVIALSAAVILGGGALAGAASLSTSTVSLAPGDTATVNCAGPSLTWSTSSSTSGNLSCATTTAPPTTTPPVTTSPSGSWWQPGPAPLEWQWEIDHPLNLTSAKDMGTSDTAYNGDVAPADTPTVYDIDGIENPASTVAALHARGDRAICYIEVGTAGNYYSAADEGIATTYYAQLQAAGVFGKKLSGYPEYFLNINSPATVSIIESMIQQQCSAKKFDVVETDLDETYSGSDGSTGFTLTEANEVTYMDTLANYMHSLGLAWAAKNPDDTGDNFATEIYPEADLVLSEQSRQYGTSSALAIFNGKKPILDAEYSLATSTFCPTDNATSSWDGAKFPSSLNGTRTPCR